MSASRNSKTSQRTAGVAGRWPLRLAWAAAAAVALFPFAAGAQTAARQLLHGQVPTAIARLHLLPLGQLPATNRLNLSIGLPLRNQAALQKLLAEIYDPASINYHRYLTPEQFAARFGPAEPDYQALIQFAKTNGLTVTATYPNRALLDVSGTAATVEKVFHVTLRVYQHPTENRTFYAPDTEPAIDLNVPVLHVSGLDDYTLPRPADLRKNPLNNRPAAAVPAFGGSGPGSSFRGNDFRTAYAPGAAINGVTLNGAGQMVGLLEFDGFYSNDIAAYETAAGIPPVTILTNLLNGFSGTPTSNSTRVFEVSMDIELVIAMATNLASVVVFEAGPFGNFDSILASMAASNQIKQFSSSWFISSTTDPNADQIFTNMAVQGQSFFQASGDGDAWVNPILVPAASPYVTCVGGTTLTMNGAGAAYASETAWNLGNDNNTAWAPINGNGYSGSGGGVSTVYAIPSWQQDLNMTANQGSTAMRNIPDVAMVADNIYVIANNGSSNPDGGGTSASAPLWAGFTALANQQAALLEKPPVGFINPAIYAIGKSPNYAAAFHDITNGNNFSGVSPTNYPAVPGYDLCTGWGTPNGQNLLNALVSPDALVIVPANGFVASGPAGGPFSPTAQIYFLTNSGAGALTWSLINTSAWLNVSTTGGTLPAGATTSVTVSLSGGAVSLPVGSYAAPVIFTNWNTRVVQSLQFVLQSLQPLVVTPTNGFTASGPVAGPFYPNAGSLFLTNIGNASLNWSLINTSAWLTASGSGTLAADAGATATVSLSPTATNLPFGSYKTSLWFTNQTKGGAQSLQFMLLVNQLLVQNGGFETGDFSDWTLSGDTTFMSVSSNPQFVHSGSFGAEMGPQNSLSYLSQTVLTLAGQNYLLSLWLNSPAVSGGNTPNEFRVVWDGNTLFDQANLPPTSGWTNLQFIVTGTKSSTVLQFGFLDDPYYLGLDDVSLAPIPAAVFQPDTTTVTNQNLTFTWNALTGLVYQVQFKTNLLQTNWTVLKSIPATNSPVSFVDTNPITGAPQKFYRLLLLP